MKKAISLFVAVLVILTQTVWAQKPLLQLPLEIGYTYRINVGYGGAVWSGLGGGIDAYHTGQNGYALDFDNPANQAAPKVLAVASGTVLKSEYDNCLGNYIKIDHGNNYFSTYGHLDSRLKTSGSIVKMGEVIGIMGNTGDCSSGSHLHFVLKQGEGSVLPEPMSGYSGFKEGFSYLAIPLNHPHGSILRTASNPDLYLIENGQKHKFESFNVWVANGQPDNLVLYVSQEELNGYPTGNQVVSRYPDYSSNFVRDPSDQLFKISGQGSTVWLFDSSQGKKRKFILNQVYNSWKYSGSIPTLLPTKYPADQPTGEQVYFRDGTLIKGSAATIYVISQGYARPFENQQVFNALGYNSGNIISLPQSNINNKNGFIGFGETLTPSNIWQDNYQMNITAGVYPPQNLVITSATISSVSLSWQDNQNSGAAYKVFRNKSAYVAGISGLSFTDNSVIQGQTYEYYVIATSNGQDSDPSNTVSTLIPTNTSNPCLQLSTNHLKFDSTQVTKTFTGYNIGGGYLDEWNIQIRNGANWFTCSPLGQGSGNFTATVTVKRSELLLGSISEYLDIPSSGGYRSVKIDATKVASGNPGLMLSTNSLDYSINKTALSFTVYNNDSGLLTWSVTSNQSWLSFSLTSGSLGINGNTVVTATVNRAALPVGVNSASITVSSNGGHRTIAVSAIKEDVPAGYAIVFQDDFERTEIGSNYQLEPSNGTIAIDKGRLKMSNLNPGYFSEMFIAPNLVNLANLVMTVDIDNGPSESLNQGTCVKFRYVDEKNYYYIGIGEDNYQNRAIIHLSKIVNGNYQQLASQPGLLSPGRYKISCVGNQLSMTNITGTGINLSAADNSIPGQGKVGFYVGEETSWFDNIIIYAPADQPDTLTVRIYVDKDTYYGTVYATNGRPNSEELAIGGWGDWYYSYVEWNLTGAPTANQVVKVEACFTVKGAAPNDPQHKLCRITSSWTEAGVTKSNKPNFTTTEAVDMPNTGLSHVGDVERGDITTIYKKWMNGTYANRGLKIHSYYNNHSNSTYYSSDYAANQNYHPYLEITYVATGGLSKKEEVTSPRDSEINTAPQEFILHQNYPNPFNPITTINFALPKASQVKLTVYDLLGKEVATVLDGWLEAGAQSVPFNASEFPSGTYFYRLTAGEFIAVRKMVLIK